MCESGTISLVNASYGRSAGEEVCPHPSILTTSCDAENSLELSSACNGLSSCTLPSTNTVFGDPCPNTYKYLELAYKCINQGKWDL